MDFEVDLHLLNFQNEIDYQKKWKQIRRCLELISIWMRIIYHSFTFSMIIQFK